MTIDVECPHCQKQLRAPQQHAGRQVKCPGCKQDILIPKAEAAAITVPNTAAIAKPQAAGKVVAKNSNGAARVAQQTAGAVVSPQKLAKAQSLPVGKPVMPAAVSVIPAAAEWRMMTGDGEEFGPVTKAELDAWLAEGRLDSGCQLLQEGWPQWKWADEVYPQLAAASHSTGSLALDATPIVTAAAPVAGPPAMPSFPQFGSTRGGPPTLKADNLFANLAAAEPAVDNPFAGSLADDEQVPRGASSTRVSSTARDGDKGWFALFAGLGAVGLTLYIALGGFSMMSLAQLIQLTSSAPAAGLAKTAGLLLFWGIMLFAGGLCATVAGWQVCTSVPRRAGTVGLVYGSMGGVGLFGVGLLLITLMAVNVVTDYRSAATLLKVGLVMMQLGASTALIMYAFFLSGTQRALGVRSLVTPALIYACIIGGLTLWNLIAMFAISPTSKGLRWLTALSELSQGITALLWLALMNGQLRKTLRLQQPWNGA